MPNPFDDAVTFVRDKPIVAVGVVVVVAGGALLALRSRGEKDMEPIPGTVGPAFDSAGTLYSTYPAPPTPQPTPIRPIPTVAEGRRLGEGNPYVCPRGSTAYVDEQGRTQCRSTKSGNVSPPRIRKGNKWETVRYG